MVTYHLHLVLKFEQKLGKIYPFCQIKSHFRKSESLKEEICDGVSCIFAF